MNNGSFDFPEFDTITYFAYQFVKSYNVPSHGLDFVNFKSSLILKLNFKIKRR